MNKNRKNRVKQNDHNARVSAARCLLLFKYPTKDVASLLNMPVTSVSAVKANITRGS